MQILAGCCHHTSLLGLTAPAALIGDPDHFGDQIIALCLQHQKSFITILSESGGDHQMFCSAHKKPKTTFAITCNISTTVSMLSVAALL